MPLPKTKIVLSQALASGKADQWIGQAAGDFSFSATGLYLSPWVSGLGDLNADTRADLIIGAPNQDATGIDAGRAYVAFGSAAGGDVFSLGDPLGQFVISGAAEGDHAGTTVGGIADLNLDGRADLLVGAPGADNVTALDAGAGYVVWGQAGAGSLNLASLGVAGNGQGYIIRGQAAGDFAGQTMVSIADQNADGRADIVIGAPGWDLPKKSGGGGGGVAKEDVGAVYVVWGKATDTPVSLANVAAGSGGYRIVGEGTHDLIGSTLGTVTDLNGDGRAEILVGAPASGVAGVDAGAVYVVFGKSTGTEVDLKSLGGGGFRILGNAAEQAGDTIASIADLNGDGKAEILVGTDNGNKLYVVYGRSATTDVLLSDVAAGLGGFAIQAEAVGDFDSMTVTAGGDLNLDGKPDIVIGAPTNNEGGRNAGAAYVVWGGTTGTVDLAVVAQGLGGAKIVGAAGSRTGASVAVLPDANGDGRPELLIGADGFGQESVTEVFSPATWQPENNVFGTTGDDTMGAGYGSGAMVIGEGHDNVLGLAGNDSIATGGGDDDLDGGAGVDTLAGGLGNDIYWIDNPGDVAVELPGEGTDTAMASTAWTMADNVEVLQLIDGATQGTGNAQANTLIAGTLAANLAGMGDADTLIGGNGNDTLDGGTGADSMAGGLGNDSYVVDEAGDVVAEAAGGGIDTVIASLDTTLGAQVENLQLTGAATTGTGNELGNTLTGGALDDSLSGLAGADVLIGGGGNDVLDGGSGNDLMAGNAGDDVYLADSSADQAVEAAGEGHDTVVASVNYTLGANVEVLQLAGIAHVGTGNAGANTLIGTAGDDTLDGAGGADLLLGGAGNDTYRVDNAADAIPEAAGEGTDTVIASVDYTLGAGIEVLQLAGAAHAGTGNDADNTVVGGSGNDLLSGAGGNDSLLGGAGLDTLSGGAGSDTLAGGAGNDTYLVDALDDTLVEAAGEGTDTVLAAIDYTLPGGLEHLTLTGAAHSGTGNDLNNAITGGTGADTLAGGAGNDTLDGGSGADVMIGGDGDDTFVIDSLDDVVVEAVGGGDDTVLLNFDATLPDNIENMRLAGTAHHAVGNATANKLIGSNTADTIDGGGGDDTLVGGDGNDELHSHSGNDVLAGGSGDDVYVIHGGSAHVEDFLGHDVVDASQSLTDDLIDLSQSGPSHIDDHSVDFGIGGSTALPLDVQFLQDLTGSFGDDIAMVRGLVPNLVSALRAVQPNSQFGSSTFVDKPVSPFGSPGEWVYETLLGLTADTAALTATYNGMTIRNGNDGPEAQIESLMHLALRPAEVGFRPESARFVVLFTDAPFHRAGDGALAGILTPNDGDAVIDGTPAGTGEDYPFIWQVKAALEAANIIPIFAIAGGFEPTYQGLVNDLGRGTVVTLTANSSNVVAAVTNGLTNATVTQIEDVHGGHGHDTIVGNGGDNDLHGNDGDDSLSGGSGRDRLHGGQGNDDLDGGLDDDTIDYTGQWVDYTVSAVGGVTTVTDHRPGSPDGTDVVRGVETFIFANGTFTAAQATDTAPVGVADVAGGVVEAGGLGNATPGQGAAAGNVLANDTDVNLSAVGLGEQLHAVAATLTGAMGTLTLQADGSWAYALDDGLAATQALAAGQVGSDVFDYTVVDLHGLQGTGTLTVEVTGANDAPASTHTVLAPVIAGSAVTITAADLLAGAFDIDGDALTATGLSASSGTLVDNGNGTWNFLPAAGDDTSVDFAFTVGDGSLSAAATATLDLLPGASLAPDTAAATAAGDEDAAAIAVVLAGSDADGTVVSFRLASLPASALLYADAGLTTPLAIGATVAASAGSATVYLVPAADFNGSTAFDFAATDDHGLVDATPATATVAIAAVNDAPVTVADVQVATEDTAATFAAAQLLANDTDIDGDVLSIASVASGTGGTATLNADGSVGFVPDADFSGAASFSYVVTDGLLAGTAATVTVNVAPVNDAPVAVADTLAATEDLAITYTAAQLLGNDTDADGNALTIASVAAIGGGTVVRNANGSVTFTPAANFNGAAQFSYVASDGTATSAAADVTVQVAAVNDAPVALADTLSATEDTAVVFDAAQLLGNDTDIDSASLAIGSVASVSGGTAVLQADGTVRFTPAANFNGTAVFSYRASDGSLLGNSANVAVAVAAINDAPVAADDGAYSVNSGLLLASIPVLANDTDVDRDLLAIDGTPTALHGTVTVNANGTLNYVSDAGYLGADSITYSVTDGALTDTASVSITVESSNLAPVVSGPVVLAAVDEDTVRTITAAELLATAADPNGDALAVLDLVASSGTLADHGDGTWTLVPVANDSSAVSFSYRVGDGLLSTAATATLDLLPVNDPAVISGLSSATVTESSTNTGVTSASGALTAIDVDGATSFAVATQGLYGTLGITAAGAWTYTLNNTNAVVDALSTGSAPLVDTAVVRTTDGTTQAIVVTILGQDDVRAGTTRDDALVGTNGNDVFSGLDGRDTLTGLAGDDYLDGGLGIDSMVGGLGDDTYVIDDARDVIVEAANAGNDTVITTLAHTLTANFENLVLGGSSNLNGTGNASANRLTGNAASNVLAGLGGADALDGGAGTDAATYAASTVGVNVSLATGLGFGGDAQGDTLVNIENLTGSGAADTLEGSSGNNVLAGGAGIDTLSYANAAAGVTVSLAMTTAQNTVGAGTDTLTALENLTGSAFDDTLTGSTAANVLSGGDGNDVLNGGAGADSLVGGAGSDRFVFALNADIATTAARDTVVDFQSLEGDLIDLSGVDAATLVVGNQAFNFIGTEAFASRAGDLRYVLTATGATLSADTNGDNVADFSIELVGVSALLATDFVL